MPRKRNLRWQLRKKARKVFQHSYLALKDEVKSLDTLGDAFPRVPPKSMGWEATLHFDYTVHKKPLIQLFFLYLKARATAPHSARTLRRNLPEVQAFRAALEEMPDLAHSLIYVKGIAILNTQQSWKQMGPLFPNGWPFKQT